MILNVIVENQNIKLTVNPMLGLKLLTGGLNVNRNNEILIKKTKVASFIDDLNKLDIKAEDLFYKFFFMVTHEYSLKIREIDATYILISKISNSEMQNKMMKIILPIYLRSLNFLGIEDKKLVLNYLKKYKTYAKKNNNSELEREIMKECDFIKSTL